jgi:hypothetical protein
MTKYKFALYIRHPITARATSGQIMHYLIQKTVTHISGDRITCTSILKWQTLWL